MAVWVMVYAKWYVHHVFTLHVHVCTLHDTSNEKFKPTFFCLAHGVYIMLVETAAIRFYHGIFACVINKSNLGKSLSHVCSNLICIEYHLFSGRCSCRVLCPIEAINIVLKIECLNCHLLVCNLSPFARRFGSRDFLS